MRISVDVLQSLLERDLAHYPSGTPEATKRWFAADQLRESLLKKFVPKEGNAVADSAALKLFLENNEKCANVEIVADSLHDEYMLGHFQKRMIDIFHRAEQSYIGYHDILSKLDVGPGASVGAAGDDFFAKLFSSTLTCTTETLYAFYRHATKFNPTWFEAEEIRSRLGVRVVSGSRLSLVPKTRKISRVICTEPSLNMLFQKGLGACLEERLMAKYSIDLSTQPELNQRLARAGSVDGSYATIDLSSASDCISLRLIDKYFPPEIRRWLMLFRSPYTVLPDGREVQLHMISSMGNGYTFPLQTIIFAAVVGAVYDTLGIQSTRNQVLFNGRTLPGNFGVFGDDIIVVGRAYRSTCRLLELLGFKVNSDKSFSEGYFRESCGADFYVGSNVRGVYIRRLESDADVYSAINRLNRWSANHAIPLPNIVGALVDTVRWLPIPFDESDDAGIKVPQVAAPAGQAKWLKVGLLSYLALEPIQRSFTTVDSASVRVPWWKTNHQGFLLAAVAGRLRGGQLTPRNLSGRKKTRLRRRVTPRWGYIPTGSYENSSFGENWKVLTLINTGKC